MLQEKHCVHERAFLGWSNLHLCARKLKVGSCYDFNNGLMLMNLLELLYKKSIGRRFNFTLRPKSQDEKEQNTLQCLNFMQSEGLGKATLEFAQQICSPDSIVYTPAVLGVLWHLILRFQFFPLFPDDSDFRTAILNWVQKRMKITEDSWTSGQGFYSLCVSIKPSVAEMSIQGETPKIQLSNVIALMENEFDLPTGIVEAEEFIQYPYDPIILLILSYLIQYRILLFRDERRQAFLDFQSDNLCYLSTLPTEVLENIAQNLLDDPLPWLFVNC